MKKTYLFLILILALSLVAVLIYYFQFSERATLSDYFPKLSEGCTLVSKNDTWNVYTNQRFGFTIDVPKEYYAWDGACENQNSNYNVTEAKVPLVVFEDYEGVLFERGYYAQIYASKYVNKPNYPYEGSIISNNCKIIPTSFIDVNSDWDWWKFVFGDINSDDGLAQFININYGSSCSVGEMELSSQQEGVYDVSIQGDGLDLGETNCPINYAYKLKYYPAQNKVMSVKLGQEGKYLARTFDSNDNEGSYYYDDKIIDSFRFLD